MIRSIALIVLAALPGAAATPQDRDEVAAELKARILLLDQAEMYGVIVEKYERHVLDTGVLSRDGEALAIVARANYEAGDETRAHQILYRAQARRGTEHFVSLERARLYMEQDDLKRARNALMDTSGKQSELRYPKEPLSLILLAKIHARLEQYDLASPAAVRFLAAEPRHREAAAAWHILSQAAVRSHDADHARRCRERAEELQTWHALLKARSVQVVRHPEDPLPLLGIALLWMEADDPFQAGEVLRELTARHPDFCRGWFHLAEAERASGLEDEALAAYDRTLACDAAHAPARMNRGMLHHEAGRSAEARADLEFLVASPAGTDPTFASAHLVLARIYSTAGESAAAAASYARYRELGGLEELAE